MANASAKRQAQLNAVLLTGLNRVAALIYIACFSFFYVGKRRYLLELLFCTPGLVCHYLLNSWCKPKYDEKGQLVSAGTDINQAGLVDYIKDGMYLTWGILLLSVAVGIRAWFILLIVPIFLGYKAFQLLKAGKQLFSGGAAPEQPADAQPVEPTQQTQQKQKVKRRYI